MFTIGLVASTAVDIGEYQLELCDVKFVLESADACVLPEEPLLFPMTVQGTPTEMKNIVTPDAESRMYDLHGRPIKNEPTEGLYIRNGRKIVAE